MVAPIENLNKKATLDERGSTIKKETPSVNAHEQVLQHTKDLEKFLTTLPEEIHTLPRNEVVDIVGRVMQHSVEDGIRLAKDLRLQPNEVMDIVVNGPMVKKHSYLESGTWFGPTQEGVMKQVLSCTKNWDYGSFPEAHVINTKLNELLQKRAGIRFGDDGTAWADSSYDGLSAQGKELIEEIDENYAHFFAPVTYGSQEIFRDAIEGPKNAEEKHAFSVLTKLEQAITEKQYDDMVCEYLKLDFPESVSNEPSKFNQRDGLRRRAFHAFKKDPQLFEKVKANMEHDGHDTELFQKWFDVNNKEAGRPYKPLNITFEEERRLAVRDLKKSIESDYSFITRAGENYLEFQQTKSYPELVLTHKPEHPDPALIEDARHYYNHIIDIIEQNIPNINLREIAGSGGFEEYLKKKLPPTELQKLTKVLESNVSSISYPTHDLEREAPHTAMTLVKNILQTRGRPDAALLSLWILDSDDFHSGDPRILYEILSEYEQSVILDSEERALFQEVKHDIRENVAKYESPMSTLKSKYQDQYMLIKQMYNPDIAFIRHYLTSADKRSQWSEKELRARNARQLSASEGFRNFLSETHNKKPTLRLEHQAPMESRSYITSERQARELMDLIIPDAWERAMEKQAKNAGKSEEEIAEQKAEKKRQEQEQQLERQASSRIPPERYLDADDQSGFEGGDPSHEAAELVISVQPPVTELLVSNIYGSYKNNRWTKVQFPITKEPLVIATEHRVTAPHPRSRGTMRLPVPLNGHIDPDSIVGISQNGEAIPLQSEINDLGETSVTVQQQFERVEYSFQNTAISAEARPISSTDYQAYKNTFVEQFGEDLTRSIVELPTDMILFVRSLRELSPVEQIEAIESYVREIFYYDMDNIEVLSQKRGASIENKMSTMKTRMQEIKRDPGKNREVLTDKKYAGVCADANTVTIALLREAGFVSGVMMGLQGSGEAVMTANSHGVAYVVWPNDANENQIIVVDGTPGPVDARQAQEMAAIGAAQPSLAEKKEQQQEILEEEVEKILERATNIDQAVSPNEQALVNRLFNTLSTHKIDQEQVSQLNAVMDAFLFSPIKNTDLTESAGQQQVTKFLELETDRLMREKQPETAGDNATLGDIQKLLDGFNARAQESGLEDDQIIQAKEIITRIYHSKLSAEESKDFDMLLQLNGLVK